MTRWVPAPSGIRVPCPGQAGAGRRGGTATLPGGPRPCPEACVASAQGAGGVFKTLESPSLGHGPLQGPYESLAGLGLPSEELAGASAGRWPIQPGHVTVLLAGLLGAASFDPPALGWGGEGATPGLGLFGPMGGEEEGAASLSFFCLGPEELVSTKQQPEGDQFPSGRARTRSPVSRCSVRHLGLHLRGSPGAPASPAPRAAVCGGREDPSGAAGPGWGPRSVREGGWGWGGGEQGASPGSQRRAFGSC